MMEHAGRYASFAEFLVRNGYTVYANDHPGHGRTARKPEELGYFEGKKGWSQVIENMHTLATIIRKENPGIPVFLFGHSMGSLLSRYYIFSNQDKIDGLILCGTNYSPQVLTLFGTALAAVTRVLCGKHHRNFMINYLAYKQFNRHFKPSETDFDWLSCDKESVRRYIHDNLCGYPSTSAFYSGLFYGLREIIKRKNINRIPKDLPIFILSGALDPVGDFTKGVNKVIDLYIQAGLINLTLKIYTDGRHEMLNEINKEDVYHDVMMWIEKQL
jgi:alpha-beta hydrolase superfamily lysophospholipase